MDLESDMVVRDCRLTRVMTALACEMWLLPPRVHREIYEIAKAHATGGDMEAEQHVKAATMEPNKHPRKYAVDGSTAVIPVQGIIGRKFSNMLYSSGVTSVDVLSRILSAAANDDAIDSVVLSFDSPGGSVMQVPQVSTEIGNLNEKKVVCAYCDGLCASAAYWMASQCSEIWAAPFADVGSIGVYLALIDRDSNTHVEMIRSGLYKGAGYPGVDLTQEQYDQMRAMVNEMGIQFRAAVRDGRAKNTQKEIKDDVMQGQSFAAEAALANGLVDGITNELGSVVWRAKELAKNRAKGK